MKFSDNSGRFSCIQSRIIGKFDIPRNNNQFLSCEGELTHTHTHTHTHFLIYIQPSGKKLRLAPPVWKTIDHLLRITKFPHCIKLQPAENITMIEQSNLHCN